MSSQLTLFLAQQAPSSPTGPEFGKASPIGLVLILALLVGTVLLIRSMNRKIKRLPESFEPEHPEADQDADEGTDRGAAKTAEPETHGDRKTGDGDVESGGSGSA